MRSYCYNAFIKMKKRTNEIITLSHIAISPTVKKGIQEVLSSRHLVQGEKVKAFEYGLTQLTKTGYAIVVNSGTAALHIALASLKLKRGDEVITSAYSFIATANAILMCDAVPVFVDIQENTFTIDPDKIESKITKKTKAIVTVDLYGQPCDYDKIKKIARKYNLKIISDSCQAIGAMYKSKPIASWTDITCYSFYASKNLIMGEGGALVTNNKKISAFAKRFRQHGQDMERPYVYHHAGYNYRATDILASIGIAQLPLLEKWNKKRLQNALQLISHLKKVPGIILPSLPSDRTHVFHQFTLRITKNFPLTRDALRTYLLSNKIQTGIYYPTILPEQKFLQAVTPYKKDMYPIAKKITKEVLSLPIHPFLKKADLNKIAFLIKKAYYEKI